MWSNISDIGTAQVSGSNDVKRLRFVNRLLFTGIIVGITMSPVLVALKDFDAAIACSGLFFFGSIGLFWFSKRGKLNVAASFASFTIIAVIMHGAITNPATELEYALLVITAFSFNLFRSYWLGGLLSVASFVAFWIIRYLQHADQNMTDYRLTEDHIQLLLVSTVTFATIILSSFYSRKEQDNYERLLKSEKDKVEKEKERSEELLLNILPAETAEELMSNGEVAAKQFNQVTVLFTDFSGFTGIAEKMTATELVKEFHYCFMNFDRIVDKYGVEKIKTIGDAYMCAGGLPEVNKTNPWDVVEAGMQMQQFMQEYKAERQKEGRPFFEVRIGIHTGSVVAGIVGVRKFAYDIWGDTVNTASRMESCGEVGEVNLSKATYELVKERTEYTFKHRGKINAKGKGQLDMYFVQR